MVQTRNIASKVGRGLASGLTDQFLGDFMAPAPRSPSGSGAGAAGAGAAGAGAGARGPYKETNWIMYLAIALCVFIVCSCCSLAVWYFFIREGFEDDTTQVGGQAGCSSGVSDLDNQTFSY